jgi:hypothetical protein
MLWRIGQTSGARLIEQVAVENQPDIKQGTGPNCDPNGRPRKIFEPATCRSPSPARPSSASVRRAPRLASDGPGAEPALSAEWACRLQSDPQSPVPLPLIALIKWPGRCRTDRSTSRSPRRPSKRRRKRSEARNWRRSCAEWCTSQLWHIGRLCGRL